MTYEYQRLDCDGMGAIQAGGSVATHTTMAILESFERNGAQLRILLRIASAKFLLWFSTFSGFTGEVRRFHFYYFIMAKSNM